MTNQQPPDAFSIECARAQDLLFDLQEAQMEAGSGITLSADDQAHLDQHLSHCANCRTYRQTMSNLAFSVAELPPAPVPAGLEVRIMVRVNQEAGKTQNGHASQPSWKKFLPMAAAVLVLALAIPLVMRFMNGPTGTEIAQQSPDGSPTAELQPADLHELANLPEQVQPLTDDNRPAGPDAQGPDAFSRNMPMDNQPSDQPVANNQDPDNTMANNRQQPEGGGTYAVDPSSLASASPQSTGQLGDIAGSEDESDVYYDPVSNLVGF